MPEETLRVLYDFSKEYCEMIGFNLEAFEIEAMKDAATILGEHDE